MKLIKNNKQNLYEKSDDAVINKDEQVSPLLTGFAADAKGKTGLKRIINAAGFSIDGFKAAYKNEAAFRQLTFINTVLMIALILCPFSIFIKMILVLVSGFSMIVELFNTGLEAAIDHTSTERHPLAKIGKDVGSAAQLLTMCLITILWIMAFFSL